MYHPEQEGENAHFRPKNLPLDHHRAFWDPQDKCDSCGGGSSTHLKDGRPTDHRRGNQNPSNTVPGGSGGVDGATSSWLGWSFVSPQLEELLFGRVSIGTGAVFNRRMNNTQTVSFIHNVHAKTVPAAKQGHDIQDC